MNGERAIDHLQWILSSPLLVNDPNALSLHDTGQDEQILRNFNGYEYSTRHRSLGYYFEALCENWLSKRSDINIVATNLPLYRLKETIGEFDLIYQKGEAHFHVELAIKFYLAIGDRRMEASWIGPNCRDRLDIKLNRMREHQLLLGGHELATPMLEKMNISSLSAFPFVKGMLFHKWSDWIADIIEHPVSISADHLTGWWLQLEQSNVFENNAYTHWTFLDKPEWIATRICLDDFNFYPVKSLARKIEERYSEYKSPVLIAVGKLNDDGLLAEASRGFIVPDNWPGLALCD